MGYTENPHFFRAIVKYGWDNFEHEILFEGLSEDEAYEKEKELIRKHKSNLYEFGASRTVFDTRGADASMDKWF